SSRVPAEERRAVQRKRHDDGVLGSDQGENRRTANSRADSGRRSDVLAATVGSACSLQKGTERIKMGSHTMRSQILIAAALLLTSMAGPAFAQFDLAGQWQALNQQDAMNRGPGPDLGDYTGLPINDEARSVALSYTAAILGM